MRTSSKHNHSVYFSHSWKQEDAMVNLFMWDRLHDTCQLLVDKFIDGMRPPYYVNRIEEYVRRSDLFLGALSLRKAPADDLGKAGGHLANVSPHCLFEVRLAERLRKPRLVAYELDTGFAPPVGLPNPSVSYVPFERNDLEAGRASYFEEALRKWVETVQQEVKPGSYRPNRDALVLLGDDARELDQCVRKALASANFNNVTSVGNLATDVQILNWLQSHSLLVADVGRPELRDIYGMAHALGVPTIRLLHARHGQPTDIPAVLRGHPAGYDTDLVRWDDLVLLENEIRDRALAMRDTRSILDHADSRFELAQRRFQRHRVFISHNLHDVNLFQAIKARLRVEGISYYEYSTDNRAGQEWRDGLKRELTASTHAVLLMADGFETSSACHEEISQLSGRLDRANLLAFVAGGRMKPTPILNEWHHEPLESSSADAANQVYDRLSSLLRM